MEKKTRKAKERGGKERRQTGVGRSRRGGTEEVDGGEGRWERGRREGGPGPQAWAGALAEVPVDKWLILVPIGCEGPMRGWSVPPSEGSVLSCHSAWSQH